MPPGIYPALFSGAGGISSAAMPDPYVPVDGTMNVTGGLTSSTTLRANVVQLAAVDSDVTFTNTSATSKGLIHNASADGASHVTVRIAATADLVTAGAKLFQLGDNAGTSFSEKFYVDKDGKIWSDISTGVVWTADSATYGFGFSGDQAAMFAGGTVVVTGSPTDTILSANGTPGAVAIATGKGFAVGGITAVKTADYVATRGDFFIPVDVNTTGSVIVTLPAANVVKGQILTIKASATHASRTITINRAGSDTIEGVTAADTSLVLSPVSTLDHVTLISDGTSKWYLRDSRGTIT